MPEIKLTAKNQGPDAGPRAPRPPSALILINNTPLRNSAIRHAQSWLKKIDKLELSLQSFRETDLRLFTEWHELTFRDLEIQIATAKDEYNERANFHNQMLFIARTKNVPIPRAYRLLVAEELRYASKSGATRAKIDETRRQRLLAMQEEERALNAKDRPVCNCAHCRAKREARGEKANTPGAANNQSEAEFFSDLTADQLKAIWGGARGPAVEFILDAFTALIPAGRVERLRKIWDSVPPRLKAEVNRVCADSYGETAEECLAEREARSKPNEDFADGYREFGPARLPSPTLNEDAKLRLKTIYRKIVRLIHPDHLDEETLATKRPWLDEIWKRSVEANERRDFEQLSRLYRQILILFGQVEDLSLSELRLLGADVQSEFGERQRQIKDIKKSPAWNFSRLKNYDKLEAKLAKPFRRAITELEMEIEEMKEERDRLDSLLAEEDTDLSSGDRRRRKSSRRAPAPNQMSFDF